MDKPFNNNNKFAGSCLARAEYSSHSAKS